MGFFHWIREGVRQAVLLGVSDAVTEIGNRQPDEDLGEHLAAALRQNLTVETETKPASASMPAGGRKRLGKSLDQIRESQRP
jgi:hypothetical protein